MTCKLGDKCDNVFACNILRPNVELLGCNFYKPKKPQTNEEWLRTATTEQLAEFVIKAMLFYDNAGITMLEAIKNAVEDNEKLTKHFVENVVEWLKQPRIKE